METKQGEVKPIAFDLFSGCGGLTEGLEQAGFKVVGAIEIDPLAVETYAYNHPHVKIWNKDITKVSVREVKRALGIKAGQLDLLAGCPPCQGFSSMRTLNGKHIIDDPRNDLVVEFMRFVEGLGPKAIMLENVPGLAEDARFKEFCAKLIVLGYKFQHQILDACNYGVPQRRERLILIGSRRVFIPFAPPSAPTITVEDAIKDLPPVGSSGDPCHDIFEKRSKKVIELIKAIPKDGGSRRDLGEDRQLACHKKTKGFYDVYGRMRWRSLSPTITSGCFNPSKGRFLHPQEDRTITIREAALLQSFPLTYYFSLRKGKIRAAEMIGNALPPEFIRRLALEIRVRV